MLEKGAKLLYLNTSTRGYPKGFRAGSNPQTPIISVDEHFEQLSYRGLNFSLLCLEVKNYFKIIIFALRRGITKFKLNRYDHSFIVFLFNSKLEWEFKNHQVFIYLVTLHMYIVITEDVLE